MKITRIIFQVLILKYDVFLTQGSLKASGEKIMQGCCVAKFITWSGCISPSWVAFSSNRRPSSGFLELKKSLNLMISENLLDSPGRCNRPASCYLLFFSNPQLYLYTFETKFRFHNSFDLKCTGEQNIWLKFQLFWSNCLSVGAFKIFLKKVP